MSKVRHCQDCKREIPAERAEALPDTRLCVECSQKKKEGEFIVKGHQSSLAKQGSMKGNPSDVTISKTRRPANDR